MAHQQAVTVDIPYQSERRTWRMGARPEVRPLADKGAEAESLVREVRKLLADKEEGRKHGT